MSKIVALHSGGLDSSTLLYYLRDQGHTVLPLTVNYGQRHSREIEAAAAICRLGGFLWRYVDLHKLNEVMSGSSQTERSIDVPEGHYEDDNMRITVVPNRNMVLLSIAVAYAVSQGAEAVTYAAHAGDRAQYPDCRPEFINAMSDVIKLCDYRPPFLTAPFSIWSKEHIAGIAYKLKVPIALTYSCYNGGVKHCGRCGTCVERAEALWLAAQNSETPCYDPTEYIDLDFWKTVTKKS